MVVCDDCGRRLRIRDIRTHNGGLVECDNCGRLLFASCVKCDWMKNSDEEQSIKHGYHQHLAMKHPEYIEKKKKIVRSWRKQGKRWSELSERFNRSINTLKKWVNEKDEKSG